MSYSMDVTNHLSDIGSYSVENHALTPAGTLDSREVVEKTDAKPLILLLKAWGATKSLYQRLVKWVDSWGSAESILTNLLESGNEQGKKKLEFTLSPEKSVQLRQDGNYREKVLEAILKHLDAKEGNTVSLTFGRSLLPAAFYSEPSMPYQALWSMGKGQDHLMGAFDEALGVINELLEKNPSLDDCTQAVFMKGGLSTEAGVYDASFGIKMTESVPYLDFIGI